MLRSNEDVHIWEADVDLDIDARADPRQYLDMHELRRADSMRSPVDRRRYLTAHHIVRVVLARYAHQRPGDLQFTQNQFGKPSLRPEESRAFQVTFNVSHSGSKLVLAVARNSALGIDIERVVSIPDWRSIAVHFFAAPEIRALEDLPSQVQNAGFFACWTRKESYVKARGEGLSIDLQGFAVTVHPHEPATLLAVDEPDQYGRWYMQDLPHDAGWAAAITVEGSRPSLTWYRYPKNIDVE